MINCPTHYVHSSCGADAVYSRHAGNRSAELSIVHFVWGPKPGMKQLDGKPPRSGYPDQYEEWAMNVHAAHLAYLAGRDGVALGDHGDQDPYVRPLLATYGKK